MNSEISSVIKIEFSDNNLLIFSSFSANIKLYVTFIIIIIANVTAANLIKNLFKSVLLFWLINDIQINKKVKQSKIKTNKFLDLEVEK